jgi:HTH-type transcriptional regulator, competence development regulator
MKLQLSPAWYEREIQNEEHLHVTAGSSRIDPLLEEARMHRAALAPRAGTTLAFGRLINLQRRHEQMSLEALAEKADVALDDLINIERCEEVRLEPHTVHKIGIALNLPMPKLLQLSGLLDTEDREFREAALRFAARSEPVEKLSREEDQALSEFVQFLAVE